MSGVFGIVSEENCVSDLFLGTFYLQHRAQDYCGLALYNGELRDYTHKGLIKQQFLKDKLNEMMGSFGIGCVSNDRQPVSELASYGGIIIAFDGNIINSKELKDKLLIDGASFSGYRSPEEISDVVLISKLIAREKDFVSGIKKFVDVMQGDFAIIALTKLGIYAARGWGRKPLIIGKKDGSYAVSSESNSFANLEIEIVRDIKPGEIVFLSKEGISSLEKLDLTPIKYGTFEWVYNAYPASTIDGKNVAEVREKIGQLLAKKYPIEADLVSPVPNSGKWYAIGYAKEFNLPYIEVFVRYDYSDRSYTLQQQISREEEAKTKLIIIKNLIKDKKIILVDDSIVRGTQTLNQVKRLKQLGAKEVHAMIACPPIKSACKFGKTTKKDEDCIARRMHLEEIKEKLSLNSLNYATIEILEEAIGFPREKLCLSCWGYDNP